MCFTISLRCDHRLPALRRVATIPGFVPVTVIYSIEKQTIWTLAHVGEKVLKLKPAIADRDASPAIIFVGGVARIGAPLDHPPPPIIGGRVLPSPTVSVLLPRARMAHDITHRLALDMAEVLVVFFAIDVEPPAAALAKMFHV